MPQQTINLPRDTTMQSIVTQLQAIASALNLDWSTIANKPSNISFHGTAATPGASVSPVGNNTPIKPCQDANGDRFSPEVFEESMYNNDGTPMHPAPGKMIAKEYDSTETYPTYSPYCIYDNKFYKFSGSSTTTGSFDPSEWTEIDAAEEFTTLNSTLATKSRVQAKLATFTIASIQSLRVADADGTIPSAYSFTPDYYIVESIGSNYIAPLMVRNWSDSTHVSVRFFNYDNTGYTNANITIRIIAVKE